MLCPFYSVHYQDSTWKKSNNMLSLNIWKGAKSVIVYYKLDTLLKERKITKTQLTKDTGISTNIVSKISKNEVLKTDTLNRICEYLHVQPSEIMEWIPDSEYEKVNAEKQAIEAQIAELQAKLKKM